MNLNYFEYPLTDHEVFRQSSVDTKSKDQNFTPQHSKVVSISEVL